MSFKYDGWENVEVINHTTDTIGNINPIRYRSYYYDSETGYYYLNSRYYDSNVGRFISSDEVTNLGANNDVQTLNLYSYCANNPVHRADEQGDIWETILFGALVGMGTQILNNIINEEPWYKEVVGATVGGAVSVACGGLAGIMFGNAASISLNYMEARICGREYSDEQALSDFVSGVIMDVGVGRILGTGVDSNNKILTRKNPKSKVEKSLLNGIDEKSPVYEMAKRGVDVLSIVLDRSVSTPTNIVNNYAGKVTSFVKSKPSTPATLFKQPTFGFHS